MEDATRRAMKLCAVCCVLCALAGCSVPPKPSAQADTDVREGVEQQASAFTLAGYRTGERKKWEVQGETADIMAEFIAMTKLVGTAYGEQATGTITADAGTVDRERQNVHLEDHVVATTSDGAILKTDSLDWNAQEEQVTTTAPVWIARHNLETTARGATAQPNLKQVALKQDVTVKVHDTPVTAPVPQADPATGPLASFVAPSPGAAAPMVITCEGPLHVDYERNIAIFQDQVHVRDARGEVFADVMDVHFDPATNAITKVIAYGRVKIVRGANAAMSDQAVYEPERGTVTLSGQPHLEVSRSSNATP